MSSIGFETFSVRVRSQHSMRVPGAFAAVLDRLLFAAVQARLAHSRRGPTREEIIDGMRKVISRAEIGRAHV